MIDYEGWDGVVIQIIDWEKLIDDKGNFPSPDGFDPFRNDWEDKEIRGGLYYALFDKEGDLREGHLNRMQTLLHQNPKWAFDCHIAQCYHSDGMNNSTKGNYHSVYYWR